MRSRSRSLPKRSLARVNDVEEIVPGKVWKVRGRSELGDRDGYYIVKLVDLKGLKRYVCSCQDPSKPFSLRRAREGCSHIGAVIAYRRMKGEDRY